MSFGFTTQSLDVGADVLWDFDTVTYQELMERMAALMLGPTPTDTARQRLANLNTALRSFMSVFKLSPTSYVERELGSNFAARLNQYAEHLKGEGASATRVRDYRSLLNRWYEAAQAAREAERAGVVSFASALGAAMEQESPPVPI
jgi:hypothetical protein